MFKFWVLVVGHMVDLGNGGKWITWTKIYFLDHFHMYKENSWAKALSKSLRIKPIPPSLQVLIPLRFLGSGTFHHETGDLCGANELTVCIIVHKVCNAICELKDNYTKFPDAADWANYKVEFYEYGNFPVVIGCIDGCHIPIKFLSTADAEEYRNRKNWFSLNVNSVCSSPTLLHFGKVHQGFLFVCSAWRWTT